MSDFIEDSSYMLPRIAFIACGSFSPPTPMHLRLFGEFNIYFWPVIIDI